MGGDWIRPFLSPRGAGTGQKEVGQVMSSFSSAAAIVASLQMLGLLQTAEELGVASAAWSPGLNVGTVRGLCLSSLVLERRATGRRCSTAGTRAGSPGARVLPRAGLRYPQGLRCPLGNAGGSSRAWLEACGWGRSGKGH